MRTFKIAFTIFCIVSYGVFVSADPHFSFEFGPSPRSVDFHTMFNTNHTTKWNAMPGRLNWFNFHQLSYLMKVGRPTDTGDSVPLNVTNNAFLTVSEARKAAEMLNSQDMNVSVTVSNGLSYGNVCRDYFNAQTAAQQAADFEFNQLTNLRNVLNEQGRNIDRIYVDGPFLRVLKFTRKDYSCANFDHNGHSQVLLGDGRLPGGNNGAVKVVHEYLKALKAHFPRSEIFLTLNIVNWKQGDLSPYYGTNAYDFSDVFGIFLRDFYKDGVDYVINGIQFDAPYSVVANNMHAFKRRVKLVYGQLTNSVSNINNMGFSFLVNSKDSFNFDQVMTNKGFYYFRSRKTDKYSNLISYSSVCSPPLNSSQISDCFNNDAKYYLDSRRYATALKDMIRGDAVLNNINSVIFTYGSWHVAPSKSIWGVNSYMNFVTEEVPRIYNY